MLTRFLAAASVIFLTLVARAEPSFKTPVSYEEADRRAEELLGKLSIDQRIQLTSGYNGFFIKGFPELGIPELYLADATGGVNIRRNLSNALAKSVSFPAPIALAATFDPGLAYRYARSVGEECRAGGIAVLLGPGMNGYRHSQYGRNFEYFGEDPILASRMIERYVMGVLETGTIPTIKHFIANESDFHRRASNSIVDQRTLHEIYLPPFKAGIDTGAMAVMTSYNQVNGEWAGQSAALINGLLRGELGYRWMVMSDWWSVWDAEKVIKSGQDLEMPGDKYLKMDAKRLLEAGKVTEADINRMAKSILRTEVAMGLMDRPIRDEYYLSKYAEHEAAALQTARAGIVLLKNRDSLLPYSKEKPILVTGRYVDVLAKGGGAADVEGYNQKTLLAALKEKYGNGVQWVPEPTDEQLKAADLVILTTGTNDSEGWDRPFALPEAEESRIKRIVSTNPRTVVVVYSGGGIRMTDWSDAAGAILYAWYPGQAGNTALAEILCGEVNPSGKLPITIERNFEDSPGADYLPKGAKLYQGWDGDNDMSFPVYPIEYKEGIFVGYRWYEARKIKPLFAFGHGLSYSKFEYGTMRIVPNKIEADGRVSVEVLVTNTGTVAGTETAQIYVRDTHARVPRPEKELRGFSRVSLAPGESRVVRVRLTARELSYWDPESKGWRIDPGEFEVLVGGASDNIAAKAKFELY